MGMHVIKMPDIGEGIAEVELVAWHVKPGDAVVEDQALADVMTDKASVEIPSPVAGKVLALGGEVGQTLAVGSELIRIEVEGREASRTQRRCGSDAPAAQHRATPAAATAPRAALGYRRRRRPHRTGPAARTPDAPATPAERPPRIALGAPPRLGARPRPARRDRAPAPTAASSTPTSRRALATRRAPRRIAPAARPRAGAHRRGQAIPVIGLRRKIAQKMQESKRRIPHFTYVEEVDVTELEDLRARLNAQVGGGAAEAHAAAVPACAPWCAACAEFPQINARFDDDAGIVTPLRRGARRHRHADRRAA